MYFLPNNWKKMNPLVFVVDDVTSLSVLCILEEGPLHGQGMRRKIEAGEVPLRDALRKLRKLNLIETIGYENRITLRGQEALADIRLCESTVGFEGSVSVQIWPRQEDVEWYGTQLLVEPHGVRVAVGDVVLPAHSYNSLSFDLEEDYLEAEPTVQQAKGQSFGKRIGVETSQLAA